MAVGLAGTWIARASMRRACGIVAALALATTLAGCSFGATGSSNGSTDQALSAAPWCAQPQVSFVDNASSSQQSITQWSQVKSQLGFTPYLPPTLPKGTCLDLVGGAIHDPIFGGHLSITWVLPNGGPLSFSEAPKRGNTATAPQCAQSAQATEATTICIGVAGDTSVTIASHLPKSQITAYFSQLQPATDWAPAPSS